MLVTENFTSIFYVPVNLQNWLIESRNLVLWISWDGSQGNRLVREDLQYGRNAQEAKEERRTLLKKESEKFQEEHKKKC